LPGGDPDAALAAFGAAGESANHPHVRHLLWKATGDRAHLREAKRLLDERVALAPEEYRETMIQCVPWHREVASA
jgi:hypothetical protein